MDRERVYISNALRELMKHTKTQTVRFVKWQVGFHKALVLRFSWVILAPGTFHIPFLPSSSHIHAMYSSLPPRHRASRDTPRSLPCACYLTLIKHCHSPWQGSTVDTTRINLSCRATSSRVFHSCCRISGYRPSYNFTNAYLLVSVSRS